MSLSAVGFAVTLVEGVRFVAPVRADLAVAAVARFPEASAFLINSSYPCQFRRLSAQHTVCRLVVVLIVGRLRQFGTVLAAFTG